MTTSKLLFALALSACTTAEDPPRVTKTFDFSGSRLDADAPTSRVAGSLNKATIRYAILTALPMLRACGATTAFEIQLGLVGAPDRPTEVATVALNGVTGEEPGFAACATRVLAAIDLPAMTASESWDVHYPIVVNAR